jgi:hypothetical protein
VSVESLEGFWWSPSKFLAEAATSADQIKVATFLLLANCALALGIALVAAQEFRRYNSTMALLLLGVSGVMFTLQAIDNAHIMSMVALSRHSSEGGGSGEAFQAIAATTLEARRWVHYTVLLAIDLWILLFYSILYRFSLVPRPIAGFGILTVLLHFGAITLPLFLGFPAVMALGVTMAVSHLVVAAWLLAKGFDERSQTE